MKRHFHVIKQYGWPGGAVDIKREDLIIEALLEVFSCVLLFPSLKEHAYCFVTFYRVAGTC